MFAFKKMKINYKNIMKHQKLLTLLFMSLPLASHAGIVISEESFPDSKFRDFLLAQPYGTDGVITDAEIADIKNLSVPNMEIVKLQGIEYFTALTELQCSSNELETLDLSNNESLTALTCANNKLKTLTLPTGPTLKYVDCSYNRLVLLDLSNHASIKILSCSNNSIALLTLPENSALTWMDCSMNQIGKSSMESLINSMPTISSGTFRVIKQDFHDEGNVACTTEQISAVKAKGWRVEAFKQIDWHEYNGGDLANIINNASLTASVDGKEFSAELPSWPMEQILIPGYIQDFSISEVRAKINGKVNSIALQYRVTDSKKLKEMSLEERLSREWTNYEMVKDDDDLWTWTGESTNMLNGLRPGTRYFLDCRLKMLTESGIVYYDNEESNFQINFCMPVVTKEEINLTANGETKVVKGSSVNLGTLNEFKLNTLTIHTNPAASFQSIVMRYFVSDEGVSGETDGIQPLPPFEEWQKAELNKTETDVWTVAPAWIVSQDITSGYTYQLFINLMATDDEGLELETNGDMTITFEFDENTGIKIIENSNKTSGCQQKQQHAYDLQGRQQETYNDRLPKGIYIINGRKVVR